MVLCRVNLIAAVLAALAPVAHVLELPNKLTLDGALWLAVQQHLYRGWGAFLGGPAEITALVTSLALAVRFHSGRAALASACYAGMIVVFFVFNAPVNAAVNRWTAASLPHDWTTYRLRWELGHAVAALLSLIAVFALLQFRASKRPA